MLSNDFLDVFLNFPKRSELISIKPIGHGTEWQESLGSLLVRIARRHTCAPLVLLNKKILPLSQISHVRQDGGFVALHIKTLNGVGKYATEVVRSLEKLTLQQDLQRCTYLSWADVLDPRGCGLLHTAPHWCKLCFREWREQSLEAYFPLIWMTLSVKRCPKHATPLSTHCSTCKREQPFVPKHACMDFCSWCGGWLATGPIGTAPDSFDLEALQYSTFELNAMTELIQHSVKSGFSASIADLRNHLRKGIDEHFEGTINRFEKAVGFRKKLIYSWITLDIRPTLPLLMKLSYRLGTTPIKLLKEGFPDEYSSNKKLWECATAYSKKKMDECELEKIHNKLKLIVDSGKSNQSMRAVARNLGVPHTFLKYHFSSECLAISALHKEHRHFEAKKKKDGQVDLAIKIMTELYEKNLRVTRRMIQKQLFPHRILLSRPEIRQALFDTRAKFHSEVKNECKSA